ncbi:3-deoxy-manno-octulosonate cytidylyltransferase [Bacteroidota bacterium]
MKIIVIIPARFASTRFPGKPLALIGDKSMIRRVYERVRLSGIRDVYIATDDIRISDHVKEFNASVIMTSSSHTTGTERCAEAYQLIGQEYDVVINVQGDEPFIDPSQINLLAKAFEDDGVQIATLREKIENAEDIENPNTIKVVGNHLNNAMFFSRSSIPFVRGKEKADWMKTTTFYKHLGIYAFRSSVLQEIVKLQSIQIEAAESLEQLRWLYHGYTIKLLECKFSGISIDSPEDLEKANDILNNIYL